MPTLPNHKGSTPIRTDAGRGRADQEAENQMISRRAVLTLPALTALGVAGAARTALADAGTLFTALNAYRASNGVAPLTRAWGADMVAQSWSEQMARTLSLEHNPSYASWLPTGWSRAGENVGYAYDDTTLNDAWVASSGHRENMLNPAFTHVGIGWVQSGDGRIWGTQDFAAYSGSVTTSTPPCLVATRSGAGRVMVRSVESRPAQFDIGGGIVGQPSVVVRDGQYEVYAQSTNGKLYVRRGWQPWQALGVDIWGGPPAAVLVGSRVEIFARNQAGALAKVVSTYPGAYSGPLVLGGKVQPGTAPAACVVAGAVTVAVVGTNLVTYTTSGDGGGFVNQGGQVLGITAATVGGVATLVARGTNSVLYQRAVSSGGWTNIGGLTYEAPIVPAPAVSTTPVAFVKGTNGYWYSRALTGGSWTKSFAAS